jgi:hypothetical protein
MNDEMLKEKPDGASGLSDSPGSEFPCELCGVEMQDSKSFKWGDEVDPVWLCEECNEKQIHLLDEPEKELFIEIGATTSGKVNVSVPGVWSKRLPIKEAELCVELLNDALRHARNNSQNSKMMDASRKEKQI